MRFLGPGVLVIAWLSRVTLLTAQTIPARDDSRHSLLRGVWLGLLPAHNAVPATQAGKVCVPLPKDEESEEIQGPTTPGPRSIRPRTRAAGQERATLRRKRRSCCSRPRARIA